MAGVQMPPAPPVSLPPDCAILATPKLPQAPPLPRSEFILVRLSSLRTSFLFSFTVTLSDRATHRHVLYLSALKRFQEKTPSSFSHLSHCVATPLSSKITGRWFRILCAVSSAASLRVQALATQLERRQPTSATAVVERRRWRRRKWFAERRKASARKRCCSWCACYEWTHQGAVRRVFHHVY